MADTPRRHLTPDDSLPPVEPPSAAFLVQLFLVPAVIVTIIVCVWLAFHWLAQLGNDPEGYVRSLRRGGEGRWQTALNFANDLRGRGGAVLKTDVDLARELAGILADEVASGRTRVAGRANEPNAAQLLCIYLCRALGEFAVPEAAEPLVARAADAADPQVAQAAVEALAVLSDNLVTAGRTFPDPAAVTAVLRAATGSDDAALRSRAAYSLGVVGGPGATDRLTELLGDAADNVRFNAAVGLARQGDTAAWEVLAEMLSLPDVAVPAGDEAKQAERYKRALVAINGLKAVGKLVDRTQAAAPPAVAALVTALRQDPVPDVRTAAMALSDKLERVSRTVSPSPEQ